MKKQVRLLFAVLLAVCTLLCAAVFAVHAEDMEYYYVDSENGVDTNSGRSADDAVRTITQAFRFGARSYADRAVIVVVNEYHLNVTATEIEHPNVPFTVTTKDDTTDYAAERGAKIVYDSAKRYVLKGDTTFENIEIDYTTSVNFVAQYNPLTFGENVTLTRLDGDTPGAYVVGGWQSPEDGFDTDLDSNITIKSGTFYCVIGNSRQKASSSAGKIEFTGTSHLTVSGGEILSLYGGTTSNNYAMNAEIEITGGHIQNLYTAGEVSRRLNGYCILKLAGGKVDTVNVNNICGKGDIYLLGTEIGTMDVSLNNADVQAAEKAANQPLTLYYDAQYYTDAQIDTFAKAGLGFDAVKNATVLYAKAGASGSGMTEKDPTSFASAYAKASAAGGTVNVIGTVDTAGVSATANKGSVTLRGVNSSAKLNVKGTFKVGTDLVLEDITLCGSADTDGKEVEIEGKTGNEVTPPTIDASVGKITVTSSVKVTDKMSVRGNAELCAGTFYSVTDAGKVLINGATVDSVTGGTDTADIEVLSGKVGTVKSAQVSIKNFTLTVNGGSVDKVIFRSITGSLAYFLFGGSVKEYAVEGESVTGSLKLDDTKYKTSDLGAAEALFTVKTEKVCYLRDGGTGNGATASAACGSFADAYSALGTSGGTIVICGKYTIPAAFKGLEEHPHTGKVTITSLYDGVDFRKTNEANITIKGNFYCGGPTEFDHIVLVNEKSYGGLLASFCDMTVGSDVECHNSNVTTTYPALLGGNYYDVENMRGTVTVNGGTWSRIRVGNITGGFKNCECTFIINGGTVQEKVYMCSPGTTNEGKLHFILNGGTLNGGIIGTAFAEEEYSFNGDMTVTLNGGTVYGRVEPYTGVGTMSGTWTVTLQGGDFGHISELVGTNEVPGGMTSKLEVSEAIDLSAKATGTMDFQNPIRNNGADPWLFFHDGYYYYIATGSTKLNLYKAANIGDFQNAVGKTIFAPEEGHMWSKNVWSPEIHHYTDEEIGAGNGGWYCYVACDDGDNINHRMYVIKCLDGDDLFGRWGNPVTGEVNVPQIIEAPDIPGFANTWAAGQTDIKINGQYYMMYVTEQERGTANHHQTINLVKMTNPWTIVGQSSVICRPEYSWEAGGYAYNASTGKSYPKVVEGGTAVYGKDGSVFIVYSGSGYWTTEYKLGQLRYLGGDPLDINSWEKSPDPIFSKSDSINGCGHASYVTDTDGQGWICYHAYKGKDTSSGRFAFVEPYTADAVNGVVIGDGGGHPAPIDKVYTVNLNPLPLSERVSSFGSTEKVAATVTRTVVKLTIGKNVGYINGAEKPLDAAPVIKNDRTMLPVRFVAEAFGAVVGWDGATSTATITGADGRVISITIGASEATVNGEKVALDSPAYIDPASNRTYLPVRVVAESLGASVEWDGATSTATLTK